MRLPHRRRQPAFPGPIQLTEAAVAISVRMRAAMLLHTSASVTPGRRSSRWIVGQCGCGRRALISASVVEAGNSRASSTSSLRSSSSGQPTPAARARWRQSTTVVAPTTKLAAILRLDMPAALSRSTSRILCMGNLCPGMSSSSQKEPRSCRFEDHPTPSFTPIHRLIEIPRNG
jgi:hypothetical protein